MHCIFGLICPERTDVRWNLIWYDIAFMHCMLMRKFCGFAMTNVFFCFIDISTTSNLTTTTTKNTPVQIILLTWFVHIIYIGMRLKIEWVVEGIPKVSLDIATSTTISIYLSVWVSKWVSEWMGKCWLLTNTYARRIHIQWIKIARTHIGIV